MKVVFTLQKLTQKRRFELFAFLALLISFVNVNGSGIGRCPKHDYMSNFNMSKFTGQWFEVERSFYLMELTSSCITIDLNENQKGNLDVSVTTVGRWSGLRKETKGIASKSKRDPTVYLFKVATKLPKAIARLLPGSGFYQILDTDYENYAVIWSCSALGVLHTDMTWVFGRAPDLSVEIRTKVYELLTQHHIDTDRLILSNNNCSFIN